MKSRALRAGGWTAVGFGAGQGLRLISTLVMTRLLAPEMFGLMAIALTVNVVVALLTDLGIKQNIVQSRRAGQFEFLHTAWTLQALRGGTLWVLSIVFSLCLHLAGRQGWLDSNTVYGAPLLPWIVVATSFATVIVGFRSTKAAIAERNFDQRRLVQIELGSQLVSLVAMVGVGTLTHSIWALVLGQWLGAIVSTVLSHTALPGHRDWFAWDEEALREILRFGRWVFVSSFIGVFALQADRIVLSGLVPAAVLGQYAIASTIVGAIQGVFNKLYSTVAMPALSETARTNRSRLREVFYRVRVPTDLALLLSAGMLAATGGWVIEILYDQRYRDAGWMLRILAISLPWIRFGADLQLYLALGMPKYVAIINGMRFAAVFVAVPVGFHLWGVPGAIWGFSLHQLVTAVLSYRFNSRLHIVDVGREVAVLFALPLGYAAGLSLLLLK